MVEKVHYLMNDALRGPSGHWTLVHVGPDKCLGRRVKALMLLGAFCLLYIYRLKCFGKTFHYRVTYAYGQNQSFEHPFKSKKLFVHRHQMKYFESADKIFLPQVPLLCHAEPIAPDPI